MKFILTYDGKLGSNKPRQKWEIRKKIGPQLEELWKINSTLIEIKNNPYVPKFPNMLIYEMHHSVEYPATVPEHFQNIGGIADNWVDLCKEIEVGGRKFLPLIRNSLALQCALKIIFLRKEEPGKVYQGGDLDNRIKTLFDALSVPNSDQIEEDSAVRDPIYCLLENDCLISGLSVETHRLLSRPDSEIDEVRLIIEVDVRVTRARAYNQVFLGE